MDIYTYPPDRQCPHTACSKGPAVVYIGGEGFLRHSIENFPFSCYIQSMTIEDIAQLCRERSVRWTHHILERIFHRGIHIADVENALLNGEIIEQYPTDYPFPSCLVLGHTKAGKTLHVVCGSSGAELWLITAYIPSPSEWKEDFRQRREK